VALEDALTIDALVVVFTILMDEVFRPILGMCHPFA
jgi:hypothetical protein